MTAVSALTPHSAVTTGERLGVASRLCTLSYTHINTHVCFYVKRHKPYIHCATDFFFKL